MKVSEIKFNTTDLVKLVLEGLGDDEVTSSGEIAKGYNRNQSSTACALARHSDVLDIETLKIGRTTYYGKPKGIKKLRDRIESRRY